MPRHVVVQGPSLSKGFMPSGMEFNPDRPYTYCRLCGEIYQPHLNRVPSVDYTDEVVLLALEQRRLWSKGHAKTHTPLEHRLLALSGRHVTSEALIKLVPFGILPVSDIAMSQYDGDSEHEQAGLEAPRMPVNDVQGARY